MRPMPAFPEIEFASTRIVTPAEFTAWVRERSRWDVNHFELLGGRVVMTPPAGYPHGAIEARLAAILVPFVRDRGLGECFGSSQGFTLPSGDIVEPDHSVVSTVRWAAMAPPVAGEFLHVVPDLVVEILSDSTARRDRGDKRVIYEANGVREYWLVDSLARQLVVFQRIGERFDAGTAYGEGTAWGSRVLPGLAIDVASLLP